MYFHPQTGLPTLLHLISQCTFSPVSVGNCCYSCRRHAFPHTNGGPSPLLSTSKLIHFKTQLAFPVLESLS